MPKLCQIHNITESSLFIFETLKISTLAISKATSDSFFSQFISLLITKELRKTIWCECYLICYNVQL